MAENELYLEDKIDKVTRCDPDVTEVLLFLFYEENLTEDRTLRFIRGLKHNSIVRKINFDRAPRTPDMYRELSSLFRVNTTIEHVKLPKGMNNVEFVPISESLCQESTSVKNLDLGGCNIHGREGGEIVAGLFQFNTRITKIDLHGNRKLGPEGATLIAEALRDHNRTLKELFLACCNIGDEGMRQLCIALHQNNALEVLFVVDNQITQDGMLQMARLLPSMKGLLKLYFNWPPGVSQEVVRSVLQGQLENDSLIYVHGNVDPLSEDGWEEWTTGSKYATARNQLKRAMIGARSEYGPRPVSRDSLRALPYLLCWCNHLNNEFGTTAHRLEEEELSKVELSLTFHLLRTRVGDLFGTGEIQTEEQPLAVRLLRAWVGYIFETGEVQTEEQPETQTQTPEAMSHTQTPQETTHREKSEAHTETVTDIPPESHTETRNETLTETLAETPKEKQMLVQESELIAQEHSRLRDVLPICGCCCHRRGVESD